MQVRAPAGLPRVGIGHDAVPGHHEAKQARLRRPRFAANTGTNGFLPCLRQLSSCGHCLSSLPRRQERGTRRGTGTGVAGYASAEAPAAFAASALAAPDAEARGAGAEAPTAPSERMSMRQPVSRAASRAFWPSLPMASESW